ncbi:MAG TPA: ABC transporter permease [Planctomycetota bacterium]|nr:ABC transporter permease [Planctomycetota bacterium]
MSRRRRAFFRNRTAIAGLVLVGLVVLAALLAPAAPYDPETRTDSFRSPPDAAHWLGTDENGFDVFSRLVHGARSALLVALAAVGIALSVGVPAGLVAGWYGGWVDGAISRAVDVMLAFPSVLLAIAIAAALGGGSAGTVILAVGIVNAPPFVRQVRAAVLQVRPLDYVAAARALGAGDARILFRTVLPNCLAPILVLATLSTGIAILDAAGLSFLGLGPPETFPDWGVMLTKARVYIQHDEQWMLLPPGLAISLTVLGFNLLGDGLSDAFDPRRLSRS